MIRLTIEKKRKGTFSTLLIQFSYLIIEWEENIVIHNNQILNVRKSNLLAILNPDSYTF